MKEQTSCAAAADKPAALPASRPVGSSESLVVQDSSEFATLLDTARFNQTWRVAKVFAASRLVPKHFINEPESVFVILQMAFRLQIDPMMLLQNTYMVSGRPGMESKLIIALVNSRGPFTGPIQWRFDGDGTSRRCTAYATHKATGAVCEATVTWQMVEAEGWSKREGSKWKTMPDLMFRYRSAAFLARLYCPEVIMGMNTVDEIEDISGESMFHPLSPPMEVSIAAQADDQASGIATADPQEQAQEKFSALVDGKRLSGKQTKLLEEFLNVTAKANNIDMAELICHAAENFESFWNSFREWVDRQKKQSPDVAANSNGQVAQILEAFKSAKTPDDFNQAVKMFQALEESENLSGTEKSMLTSAMSAAEEAFRM